MSEAYVGHIFDIDNLFFQLDEAINVIPSLNTH